ncbi:MAG: DNA-processing protein DprA [Microbacteriaceae bacterium]
MKLRAASNLEAAIWWSIICEPGDELAGFLRQAIGYQNALRCISELTPAQQLRELAQTEQFESAQARFGDIERTIRESSERYLPRLNSAEFARAMRFYETRPTWITSAQDSDWPGQLNDLGWGAPACLWGLGDRTNLAFLDDSVAVVGSRGATEYGRWVTVDFVTELVAAGKVVVSGGAFGIDAIAHRAALDVEGRSVAVMAGGLERLYPSGHSELFESLAKSGLILSELSPDKSPTKWRFLLRNRIIAALSRVTVVIEAGARSGAINTVNHANGMGRPVAAVPGAITSSASVGTNRLIAENAASLVTSAGDILALTGEATLFEWDVEAIDLGPSQKRALDELSHRPRTLVEVATLAGLTQGEASRALAQLCLVNAAREVADGYVRV